MIDFDLEIEKVHAINLKEIELNRYKIDDNIKKAIILYNTAIGEMKKSNFNLVISDLKKALSYNKDFTEAVKLMGLCYVNMNKYKKAEKTFKSLNKYEMYHELVNEYMESLLIKKAIFNNKTVSKAVGNIYNKREQAGAVKNLRKKIIISLLIAMIAIAGISINYFYPEVINCFLTKFRTSSQGVQEKFQVSNKTDSDDEIDRNLEENIISNEEPENTQGNSEDIKLEVDNYKNNTINMLNDAEKSLNAGKFEEAASILVSMKSGNFDDETRVKFNRLWQNLKPNPLWTIYNEGNKLYKQKNYAEALPKLIIASEIDPNLELMPWITFQIGMCYKETKDNVNALIYFNKVKDNYPKSEYASNARMMINQIGN